MSWNPNQYLKFSSARIRPAIDLLNRVNVYNNNNIDGVKTIIDLGYMTILYF